MANRRARTRRKENKIVETISNKTFITLSIILIIIIVICILTMQIINYRQKQKIAEEQKRINSQIEDIFVSTKAKMESLNDYKTSQIIRLSAVGDILCGNNLKNYGKDYNNIFTDISKYFKDVDFTLGTYETTITEDTKSFADAVKQSGIDFVSLAHNHALDYGIDGLNKTKEYLENIGIKTVGVKEELPENRVKIIEIKGTKIAILGYTYDNKKTGVNIFSEDLVKEDLNYAEQNAALTIVMMHWGNVNTNEVSKTQEEQAKFLINEGADIIIGAHPSAVQKMEVVQNKDFKDCFIAYSIGDYTSDFTIENANLELILNIQIFVDKEGTASLYKVDYTPVYMFDNGASYKENRFKILDMKKEIANYGEEISTIDKNTYDKLVRGVDRLNQILGN